MARNPASAFDCAQRHREISRHAAIGDTEAQAISSQLATGKPAAPMKISGSARRSAKAPLLIVSEAMVKHFCFLLWPAEVPAPSKHRQAEVQLLRIPLDDPLWTAALKRTERSYNTKEMR